MLAHEIGYKHDMIMIKSMFELGEKRAVELNGGAIMTVLKTEENRMKHQIGQRSRTNLY